MKEQLGRSLVSYSSIVPATIGPGNPLPTQTNCTPSLPDSGNCTPTELAFRTSPAQAKHQASLVSLEVRLHPSRAQRYLLQVCQGDRAWAYPLAWTRAELMALRMMARNSIYSLNLELTPEGPPKDVGKLHGLIERLYPSVARVAAMAQEVAA
jgi:hypothetical protein